MATPNKPTEFHFIKLTLSKSDLDDRRMIFKLSILNDSSRVLHLIKPGSSDGSLEFMMRTNGQISTSKLSVITTPVGFNGWVMHPHDEFTVDVNARMSEDGTLFIEDSEQSFSVSAKKFEIAANALIRVADFRSEACKSVRLQSNFILIEFPFDMVPEENKLDKKQTSPPLEDPVLPDLY